MRFVASIELCWISLYVGSGICYKKNSFWDFARTFELIMMLFKAFGA